MNDDDRAIAEALGWRYLKGPVPAAGSFWFDREQTQARTSMPTLETDRALCMDAVEWLGDRLIYLRPMQYAPAWVALSVVNHESLSRGRETIAAALRAAMLRELNR